MAERKTDIVYFLGAGFSAPFGIPTMKDMVSNFDEEEMQIRREIEYLFIKVKRESFDPSSRWEKSSYIDEIIDEFVKDAHSRLYLLSDDAKGKIYRFRERYRYVGKDPFTDIHMIWAVLAREVDFWKREELIWTHDFNREKLGMSAEMKRIRTRKIRRHLRKIDLDIETIISRMNDSYIQSMLDDPNYWFVLANRVTRVFGDEPNFGKEGEIFKHVIKSVEKFRDFLFEYIRNVCSPKLDQHRIVMQLRNLVEDTKALNVDIFTTNYDVVIENLLDGLDIPLELGIELDRRVGITYWDFKRIAESNNRIRLIKLHGSIDLYSTSDGRIIKLPTPTAGGSLVDGREIHEMLIYPTQQKSVNDTPYCDMFEALTDAISQAKVLVFIGFNFNYNDKHISEAVEKGIANNRQLKKVVVVKGQPEDSVKELLKIKGLGRKRIKAIAGRMPKREVASEIVTTIREVLG